MSIPTPHTSTLTDLFNLQIIQSAEISPNGCFVAFVASNYDESEDKDYHHIWLYNRANDESRQITFGKHNHSSLAWSPDSGSLAFVSNRSGENQIYLLPMSGGEARPITDIEQGVTGSIFWSPDGTQIAFSAGLLPKDLPDLTEPYRVTRHVYRFDTLGYTDGAVQNIFTIDIATGAQKQWTAGQTRNQVSGWSPSGDQLLYFEFLQPDSHYSDLKQFCVLDFPTGKITHVMSNWGNIAGAAWHPDGEQIVFIGWPDGAMRGSKADLYVADLAGERAPENRTADLKCGVGGLLLDGMPSGLMIKSREIYVTKDGESAIAHVQIGGTIHLFKIALRGEISHQPIVIGDRTIYLMGLDQTDETLLFIAADLHQPYALFLANSDGRSEKQITNLNEQFLTQTPQKRIKHLTFTGKHDVKVEGWLIMPPTGDGPFPTILEIHGGPHCGYGHTYHVIVEFLISAGFAVLMINHRGSTGYGDDFGTALYGDWGNLDYADLMAGLDCAIETGYVDGDKLGVCGISGGGYLSSWIIGQTGRFKAAAPENPVTNWHSFYGTSDIGVRFGLGQMGGHPHEIPETYARCSPINYAHQCTTPTLLIQGEADWRCPAEQSEQFYTVLKANGCRVEMLRLPAASHAGSVYGPPKIRRAKLEALLDWMNRYVLGE